MCFTVLSINACSSALIESKETWYLTSKSVSGTETDCSSVNWSRQMSIAQIDTNLSNHPALYITIGHSPFSFSSGDVMPSYFLFTIFQKEMSCAE
uniref:RTX n=1 Tax=Cotesia plutellae bracovirus TaxID=360638 RepID=B3FWU1_9VIRU|nr:RTX [Cotesia plutellae bracovirus]